eukprot:scaffold443_cov527-Prasinococcus_capsulatus_cf.AAC.11
MAAATATAGGRRPGARRAAYKGRGVARAQRPERQPRGAREHPEGVGVQRGAADHGRAVCGCIGVHCARGL